MSQECNRQAELKKQLIEDADYENVELIEENVYGHEEESMRDEVVVKDEDNLEWEIIGEDYELVVNHELVREPAEQIMRPENLIKFEEPIMSIELSEKNEEYKDKSVDQDEIDDPLYEEIRSRFYTILMVAAILFFCIMVDLLEINRTILMEICSVWLLVCIHSAITISRAGA